ncbi:MAG: hypothetical protein ACYC8T_05310 [Myxococcaceae bacterium]
MTGISRANRRSPSAVKESTPALRPSAARPTGVLSGQSEFTASRPKLQQLLRDNPGIRTNQDLINHFYAVGGNTWNGAEAQAKAVDADLNALVKDRPGLAARYAGVPAEIPSPAPAEVPAPPPPVETPAVPPAASQSPLQSLLDANPAIKTNQDLINHFFKASGNRWDGAETGAAMVGLELDALVKNRSGQASAWLATVANAPLAGPMPVDYQAGEVSASGITRAAYDDFAAKFGAGVELNPAYLTELNKVMGRVDEKLAIIDQIAREADLPRELVAAIWYRESGSMPTDVYLHNGEKLGKPTTLVPAGIFFRTDQFAEAAAHALKMKSSTAHALGLHYGSKDFAAMATFTEAYNGFGYRNRDRPSGYVLAGTQYYQGGMYVADGVFDPNKTDRRPGSVVIMMEMARRFPES